MSLSIWIRLRVEDATYMAFIPANTPEDAESAELIILKVEEDNGEEILVTVDDEAECERMYALFMEHINEPLGRRKLTALSLPAALVFWMP